MESNIDKLTRELAQAQETTRQIELELQKAQQQKSSPEERLLELLKPCVIKYDFDKYPGQLFWFDGKEIVMEQESKNDNLWVHYDKIWSFFESEFELNNNEIRELIKGTVEKHFNLNVGTPGWLRRVSMCLVEKHFNLNVGTPLAIGE